MSAGSFWPSPSMVAITVKRAARMPRAQAGALAGIGQVADQPQLGKTLLEGRNLAGRSIPRAIVDDDHLAEHIVGHGLEGLGNEATDIALLVEGWDDDGNLHVCRGDSALVSCSRAGCGVCLTCGGVNPIHAANWQGPQARSRHTARRPELADHLTLDVRIGDRQLTTIRHIEGAPSRKQETAHGLWLRRTLLVLGVILAVRLVSLWFNNTELFFDEAQYWVWGKAPAFGYFSKPPVLAWIIGAVTGLFGNSEFAVRLASPILHTATALTIFFIARKLFDGRTGFWSALVYATLPAVSLSATLISTDVPLLFFWAWRFSPSSISRRTTASAGRSLLGLALGAGLMSKYAMIYFLPCAVIYALLVSERPHVLKRRGFWLALAIGGLLAGAQHRLEPQERLRHGRPYRRQHRLGRPAAFRPSAPNSWARNSP